MSPETLEAFRKQAIRLRRKRMSFVEIAEIIGVKRQTVSDWWKKYEAEGIKGLKPRKRGRRFGEHRTLNSAQETAIQCLIGDNAPDQYKLSFALWTREAVRERIRDRFGIPMPVRTVGSYLARWGFTPQKPLRRAYEQRPTEVRQWVEQEYPVIAARARVEGVQIHWGDETGVRSDCQHGRSYAPKGKTPEIRLSASRHSLNMISSVTNQGKVRFMVYAERMNAKTLIRFLRRLIRDAGRKVFLILDNLRGHHAKVVKQWLAEHQDQIEIFYLPSYSPELNPDEYLNCDLKAGVHSKSPARDQESLKRKVISHMKKLQNLPGRVKKYFQHPKIAYAG